MENLKLAPYYLKRICNQSCCFEEEFLSDIIDIEDEINRQLNLLNQMLEKLDLSIYLDIGQISGDKRKKAIKYAKRRSKKAS